MIQLSPLVFFGTEEFSVEILHGLISSDFKIEAVITKPDLISGRGRQKRPTEVKQLALASGIPVLEISNKGELRQAIAKTSRQTGILASFGKIIPDDVITAFKYGIINVHPSLLPLHRGPSPIENAILQGDSETGISIMLLANEVDAGDVYSQESIRLSGQETAKDLYQQLAKLGASTLVKTLHQIENGLKAQPQDHSKATFSHMISKADGLLNPKKYAAQDLERQIRAYNLWPKSRLIYRGREIIVLEASVSNKAETELSICCKNNTYLNIKTVLSPSGKPTSAKQYINNFLTK